MDNLNELLPQPDFLFPDIVSEYTEGRDELNLAEFPIASLTRQIDPNVKTIHSTDTIWDNSTKSYIERKVTVTASDKFGLPNPIDEEVVLGLIQLSRLQGFRTHEVWFTRYQLIKILGWPANTYSYKRIKESLFRWKGVTLFYENAWREKDSNTWKSTAFSIIDNVEIWEANKPGVYAKEGRCYFKWNDVVFDSFQAGNLKSLDFGIYRKLNLPTAKRLFRFLDKRFYNRTTLEFELEPFLYKKLGFSKNYKDITQLKRSVLPAIQELEKVGFIEAVEPEDRFTKVKGSTWSIHFTKAKTPKASAPETITLEEYNDNLASALIGHGVTSRQAKMTVKKFPEEYILSKIQELEFILTDPTAVIPENPAGWLMRSIHENWKEPKGFKTEAQKEAERLQQEKIKEEKAARKRRKEAEERERVQAEENSFKEKQKRVQLYIDSLSPADQEELRKEAIASLPGSETWISSMREALISTYAANKLAELEKQAGDKGQTSLRFDE